MNKLYLVAAVALVALAVVPAPAEAASDVYIHCEDGRYMALDVWLDRWTHGDTSCIPFPNLDP